MIEVKWSDAAPSPAFSHYKAFFSNIQQVQLVKELLRETMYPDGVEVRKLISWLIDFSLSTRL